MDTIAEGRLYVKDLSEYSLEEKRMVEIDELAKDLLILSNTNVILMNIDICESTKDLCDKIEKRLRGTRLGARTKLTPTIMS